MLFSPTISCNMVGWMVQAHAMLCWRGDRLRYEGTIKMRFFSQGNRIEQITWSRRNLRDRTHWIDQQLMMLAELGAPKIVGDNRVWGSDTKSFFPITPINQPTIGLMEVNLQNQI
jgi:hypothetical protein